MLSEHNSQIKTRLNQGIIDCWKIKKIDSFFAHTINTAIKVERQSVQGVRIDSNYSIIYLFYLYSITILYLF